MTNELDQTQGARRPYDFCSDVWVKTEVANYESENQN